MLAAPPEPRGEVRVGVQVVRRLRPRPLAYLRLYRYSLSGAQLDTRIALGEAAREAAKLTVLSIIS